MKAIILAAGFGSRLMPLTQKNPKCMVEYQNKKIIDYVIKALNANGISDIAVVGGYSFEILEQYLQKFLGIKVYRNEDFDTTNMVQTLFCAREYLESCITQKQDLIISYADIVYFEDTISALKDVDNDFCIVVDKEWKKLWEKRFIDPLDDAETLKINNGKIIELGKKPKSYDEIQAQYIGLFKFSYKFLPCVIEYFDTLDRNVLYDGKDFKNMYMTSFLQGLIDKYHNALAVEIYGNWCEIDFKSDLEISI